LIDDAFAGAGGIMAAGAADHPKPTASGIHPSREPWPADRRLRPVICSMLIPGVPMHLTTFTDYTLRTLIYLAVRPGITVTISDIANVYGISGNHLTKVVHQLALAGDVATTRGQHGGLRLAREPGSINIGEVVRRAEPDFELVACFGEARHCVIAEGCVLRHALGAALQAFLTVLDGYTLADLVEPRQMLAGLLGIASQCEPRSVRPQ
jgi:Rrf2 family nitric oxide-sensitive transcriptional repressor